MLFWTTIKLALRSLVGNKLRSALTMLGMIIGVAAVIAMLALGNGARKQILSDVSRNGHNTLTIFAHQPHVNPVLMGTPSGLTVGDADACLKVPGVKLVSPVSAGFKHLQWGTHVDNCNVIGIASTWLKIHDFRVKSGRMFNGMDTRRLAAVAVIGPETATRLFGAINPIGHRIEVGTMPFRILGVLVAKGRHGWYDPDNQILIPYTTAMTDLFAASYLSHIDLQADHEKDLQPVQTRLTRMMRIRHRLIYGDRNDFWIGSQLQIIRTVSRVTGIFTLFLGCIGGISLLVGGIGIMNIMLVTVTERTREIGIRKAIGARRRDILRQFLIESVLISMLGGFGGAALGIWASSMVHLGHFTGAVTPSMPIFALSISVGIGVFFGYYPARRAAGLNPIEALRYE